MENIAQFALVSLTSLLFIVDPVAVVPAYLFITSGEAAENQRRTAKHRNDDSVDILRRHRQPAFSRIWHYPARV